MTTPGYLYIANALLLNKASFFVRRHHKINDFDTR